MNTPLPSFDRRSFLRTVAAGSALAALPRLSAQATSAVSSAGSPPPAEADGAERQILRPRSKANPKNTEGSGIVLKDGSILLLFTEFLDFNLMPGKDRPPFSAMRREPDSDDGYARISGILSKDGGRTWSEPRVYVDDRDAKVNTMSPAITRLKDGRLLLAYSWRSGGNHKDNYGETARRVRLSSDEGQTWSEPVRITPADGEYHTGCHDRAWTLPSGRVLVQCHTNRPRKNGGAGDTSFQKAVYISYSDDSGKTWKYSNTLSEPKAGGLNESCLTLRADGSLLMVLRSWRGQSFYSDSHDDGSSWSEPRPSGVTSPDAPSYLTRLPGTDDLLLIWNNNFNPRLHQQLLIPAADGNAARSVAIPMQAIARCPLLCAVSRDGGRTWGLPKALETDINYAWAYAGVVFHGDEALVHYFRSPTITHGRDLMLARVPTSWFYA